MDETQRRKLSAKEFLIKNRKIGYGVLALFLSLFILYFSLVYFYSHESAVLESQNIVGTTTRQLGQEFIDSLLPIFSVSSGSSTDLDEDFLSNFNNPNIIQSSGDNPSDDTSKVLKVEDKPILGFTVFDKPISIKNYIKNKPKICAEKIEPVVKKEEKSTSVLNFQNTLRNMDDYNDTPDTGILDEGTREKLYIFQTRYADILYKNKTDKTPSRVIDKETAHFLNLLCNLESENKDDYVQVPTLRYVLKETRQIFDYNTDSKQKTEVEAKLATGTQDLVLSKNGDLAVFRKDTNGTIDTIFYNIKTKSLTHLENNISTLDFNDKGELIYGVPGYQGMTIKSYNYIGNSITRIATLPLNEWDIRNISPTEIGIVSKPTAFSEGIYMTLDTKTKKLRQIAGPLLGMSIQKTSIPDFSIMSIGGQGQVRTLLVNNKTRNIGDFGINTFAEKCAQTIFADGIFCAVPKSIPQNFIYPDDWYKGKVFTEDILMYKTLSGTSTKTISFLENRPLSIVNLNVNKNGIFFMDENSLNLYSLEL
jgi:hypothetical protein